MSKVFFFFFLLLCRVSFLTTLNIYKDYFKSRPRWCNLMQSDYLLKLRLEKIFPSSSFSCRSCCVCAPRVCNQGAYWSSLLGWTEELCYQHLSQVGVLVTYWNLCINWLVTYSEPCIERRDCHYITSPIVYWDKGLTVVWYKVHIYNGLTSGHDRMSTFYSELTSSQDHTLAFSLEAT